MTVGDPRGLLEGLFQAALAAADPAKVVAPHLPPAAAGGNGRIVVVGAGKAAGSMARAVEDHWGEAHLSETGSGLVRSSAGG